MQWHFLEVFEIGVWLFENIWIKFNELNNDYFDDDEDNFFDEDMAPIDVIEDGDGIIDIEDEEQDQAVACIETYKNGIGILEILWFHSRPSFLMIITLLDINSCS